MAKILIVDMYLARNESQTQAMVLLKLETVYRYVPHM